MKRFSFVPRKRPDILCGTLQLDAFGDWVRYEDADARIVGLESALMDYQRRVKELEYGIEIGAKEWYENRCRRYEEDKKIAAKIRNLEAQLTAAQELEATYTEYKCKLEAIVTWLAHHERGAFAHDLWDILYE